MSDVIGRGVIEVSGDSSKLNAAIAEARRNVKGLGDTQKDASTKASASIDRYVRSLQTQQAVLGKSAREAELYKLATRGASDEQLRAANNALKLSEAYQKGEAIGARVRGSLIAAAAASTVVAAGLVNMTISAVNAADHLNDLSKVTGISVEDLAGLSLAAKQSGTDLDGVATSITKLSQNIGKDGDRFRELGITATDPLEAFKQLADIFVAIDDPQKRAALGAAALGKSWQSAAPLLAEGSKNIGDMITKGTKLSGVTTQLAQDSDKLNDQLEELKTRSSGLGAKIASEMVPGLTKATEAISLAYTESGKLSALWTGLGAFGAFLFTDEFSSAQVKVKNLNEEIEDLEKTKTRLAGDKLGLDKFIFGTPGEIDKKIENLRSQIESLTKPIKVPVIVEDYSNEGRNQAVNGKVDDFLGKEDKDKKAAAAAAEARQNAKSRLAYALEDIKSASVATINEYANSEKIMQAQRSAGLLNEQEYYAEKEKFISLNSAEREKATQLEISRLQREKLSGKDAIDNKRKIGQAEAELAKIRADATADLKVNSIDAEDANKRVQQSFENATESASEYLAAIERQNGREIASIGRGTKFKNEQDGRNALEDKLIDRKLELGRDNRNGLLSDEDFEKYLDVARDTYEKEVALFEDRNRKIEAKQGNWINGATTAYENYLDGSRNIADQTEHLFTDAFQGMEDALISFVETGKGDFRSLADSIISDLGRILIKQELTQIASSIRGSGGSDFIGSIASYAMSFLPSSGAGEGLGGAAASSGSLFSLTGDIVRGRRAIGGPVTAGGLYQVNENGPELLNVAGKQFLMMGDQGGSVSPRAGGGGSQPFNQTNHFHVAGPVDRRTQGQIFAVTERAARIASARNN